MDCLSKFNGFPCQNQWMSFRNQYIIIIYFYLISKAFIVKYLVCLSKFNGFRFKIIGFILQIKGFPCQSKGFPLKINWFPFKIKGFSFKHQWIPFSQPQTRTKTKDLKIPEIPKIPKDVLGSDLRIFRNFGFGFSQP